MMFVWSMSHCNAWGHAWMESCLWNANTDTNKLDNAPAFRLFYTCHDQCGGEVTGSAKSTESKVHVKKFPGSTLYLWFCSASSRPKHQKFLMSSAKLANNHGQDCNDLCQVPTSTPQQQAPRQPLLQISKHQHWWHSEHVTRNQKVLWKISKKYI